MRAHILVTTLALSVYFLVAFFDPGFLSYDLRQKFHVFADDTIVLSAVVLDAPETPIVTATSVCSAGTLSVLLDWADDANSYSYDIERDALPLVSGIVTSGYSDTAVSLATTYDYVVTAYGPMGPGFATGAPVSVTTDAVCEVAAADPTVSITTLDGRSIATYNGTPRISDRRPTFTGTTSIPNAIVEIVVGPPSGVAVSLIANANGYFEWEPTTNLDYGAQTFTVTAIDPFDTARVATTSLYFEIKRKSDDSGGKTKKPATPASPEMIDQDESTPIDFSLVIANNMKEIFQGGTIGAILTIQNIASAFTDTKSIIRYSIVDSQGREIISKSEEQLLSRGSEIQNHIDIPLYVSSGEYAVVVTIANGTTTSSRSAKFLVKELPLISLGGGAVVTYASAVRNIGWTSLMLLASISAWFSLLLREYRLVLSGLRRITELSLLQAGFFFIIKRKGGRR